MTTEMMSKIEYAHFERNKNNQILIRQSHGQSVVLFTYETQHLKPLTLTYTRDSSGTA